MLARGIRLQQPVAGKIGPAEAREVVPQRERPAREDGHAALPGEPSEAMRVARAIRMAIAVKVVAASDTGIRHGGKDVLIVRAQRADGIAKRREAVPIVIVVDTLQKNYVRIGRCDQIGGGEDVRRLTRQNVAQEKARAVAGEFRVERGDADRLCRRRKCRGKEREDQAGAKVPSRSACSPFSFRLCSIMAAIRPMAMPRMKRDAGKKAHAATVQIRVCGFRSETEPKVAAAALITAGVKNGRRNPNAMLKRASRSSRSTTSPPAVGSKVGRLTQTLNAPVCFGQP